MFSSILPNFTNWLPSWWAVYGWFFGVAIAGGIYYAAGGRRSRSAEGRLRRRSKKNGAETSLAPFSRPAIFKVIAKAPSW